MDLAELRREYSQVPLLESQVDTDPVRQFDVWFNQALDAGITDPNAMTLPCEIRRRHALYLYFEIRRRRGRSDVVFAGRDAGPCGLGWCLDPVATP